MGTDSPKTNGPPVKMAQHSGSQLEAKPYCNVHLVCDNEDSSNLIPNGYDIREVDKVKTTSI